MNPIFNLIKVVTFFATINFINLIKMISLIDIFSSNKTNLIIFFMKCRDFSIKELLK